MGILVNGVQICTAIGDIRTLERLDAKIMVLDLVLPDIEGKEDFCFNQNKATIENCNLIGGCWPGESKLMEFDNSRIFLSSRVIFTRAPVLGQCGGDEKECLQSCYSSALDQVQRFKSVQVVAFPHINKASCGLEDQFVAKTAVDTVVNYANNNQGFRNIIFVDANPNIVVHYRNEFLKHLNR